jgi:hypothetical protein
LPHQARQGKRAEQELDIKEPAFPTSLCRDTPLEAGIPAIFWRSIALFASNLAGKYAA